MSSADKDYSSISPSAGWLINLKAHTTIPFAKEAAEIMFPKAANTPPPETSEEQKKMFFMWLIHFENRYRTVEELLTETNPQNILEISSGYSFRSIDWCMRLPVHFIDTDLPDLIKGKTTLTNQLIDDNPNSQEGKLEVLPLNAMDRANFMDVVSRFAPGPITIVNEGLLVYLNDDEKKQLCATIHDILKQRGGYWITGDIYIKTAEDKKATAFNKKIDTFRQEHNIHENQFDSFEAAEQFFTGCGFTIKKRLASVLDKLSAFSLLGDKKDAALQAAGQFPANRESWLLSVSPDK